MNNLTCLFLLLLLVTSCAQESETTDNSNPMASFASQTSFQNAHEEPAAFTYEGKGDYIKIPCPSGKDANAFLIASEEKSNNYLILIHEWYGLNDFVKNEAEKFFDKYENINVIAMDMYDGNVADNREDASKYMRAVKEERAQEIVNATINYTGEQAKIATLGWCFGGGWSLKTAINAADKATACVIYYGSPVETAQEIAPLKAPVLGIFAEKDKWINRDMIGKFTTLTDATKKDFEAHWFDAEHAFANPSGGRYSEKAAQEAQLIVDKFLNKNWYSKN